MARDEKSRASYEKLSSHYGKEKSLTPQGSPRQDRSQSGVEPLVRGLQNRFNLPDIANIASTSKQGLYLDNSDSYPTTDLDEEEIEAMAVKTVIQIKIKPDDKLDEKNTKPEGQPFPQDTPFTEDPYKLGLHNLSESERKKLSLGTQKSFEDNAERDLSDMLHGSSELMLLLLPNTSSSRENSEERELRKKEMSINLSIDNIMAPPVSLSAPEINFGVFYLEDNCEIPIREAFSSTELLQTRKMERLYQSLEEIEAENEEYKKKMREKSAAVETKEKLSRKRSLTVEDKKKILLERRKSSETEDSDTGRKYVDIMDRIKEIKSRLSEDEAMSDVNYPADDNSEAEGTPGKKITFGVTYHSDLETQYEDDYDIVEKNELELSHVRGDDGNVSDCYLEKTLQESGYGYDSDELKDYLLDDNSSRDRSHTPVVKDEEYYEKLGDVLTKKYSLPINEIQIKIDKPTDDESDFVLKGTYEVDNEMLLKRSKLKPQYSSELSEASNLSDDEEEEVVDNEVDFDDFFEENPEESGGEMDEPINLARNRYQRYIDEEEDLTYHPKSISQPSEDFNLPPPVPEHQESVPEIPLRTSSRLSPHLMLKKQPVKPILKNKGKKVGKILDVEIHIDNTEPHFDNIELKSPKATRKKKGSPEEARKLKLSAILKPILKKDGEKRDVEKDEEKFTQFPAKSGDNILLIPKSLQKVSDVESDTDTEKSRRKHVRIKEPGDATDDVMHSAANNHYSDLVREYGGRSKSAATRMILNYEELKARATEVENAQSVDWDTVAETSKEPVAADYASEMRDPFSSTKETTDINRFGMEVLSSPVDTVEIEVNKHKLQEIRNTWNAIGMSDVASKSENQQKVRESNQQRSRESSLTRSKSNQRRIRDSSVTRDVSQSGGHESSITKSSQHRTRDSSLTRSNKQRSRESSVTKDFNQQRGRETSLTRSIPSQQMSRERSITKDFDQQVVLADPKAKQARIHSYFDYTVDVLVFGIACWIYFFKHPILCVPILLLLICKQIYENWETFLFWKKYYKQYEQSPK